VDADKFFNTKIDDKKMNIETQFKEEASKRIWDNYFKRVNRFLRSVPAQQKDEMILELKGHLWESMTNDNAEKEVDRILNALEKLGEPDEFLKPIVADKLLLNASRTLSPKSLILGLIFNFYAGIKRASITLIMGTCYTLLIVFGIMTILKAFFPNNVGLFRNPNGSILLGIDPDMPGAQDLLGYWFIPIGLFITVILYFLITKLLKVFIKHKY